MRKKRLVVSLLIVVILVCAMPVTAFAETYIENEQHPITDFRNTQFVPAWNGISPISTPNFDAILVKYNLMPDGEKQVHSYTFYFVKNGQYTVNSSTGIATTTTSVPYVYAVYSLDSANDPYMIAPFAWYPEKFGYTAKGTLHLTASNGIKVIAVIENPNSSFPTTPPPLPSLPEPPKPPDPPPDPPDPPAPPAPPMVIPPHDPDMVTWDTDRIKGFFEYVSAAIGHIVNVGIVYFGIILAVYVMIRIIKTFENSSAGGGG